MRFVAAVGKDDLVGFLPSRDDPDIWCVCAGELLYDLVCFGHRRSV